MPFKKGQSGNPAGRKKGSLNKRTQEIWDSGLMPLEYMLQVLRDPMADPKRRDWAAEKAAPYLHARLQATEITGKDGGAVQVEEINGMDLARKIAHVLARESFKSQAVH